jgi:hypothetical protein
MRLRVICVALAGLALLASATPAPAATQTFQCTDTAAVALRLSPAGCGIDVSCPSSAGACAVELQASGRGVGLIRVETGMDGRILRSCEALLSCQTGKATRFMLPGSTSFFVAFVNGVPVAALAEVRLVLKKNELTL